MAVGLLAYVGLGVAIAFILSMMTLAYFAIDVNVFNDDGSKPVEWRSIDYAGKKPPEPIYNNLDDEKCRDLIKIYYTDATSSYDY